MPNIAIAPSNLNSVAGSRQATLTWTYNPKTLATGFRLFVSDNGGVTWTARPDLPLNPKATTVSPLFPGRSYHFRIQAINTKTKGESNFSNVVGVAIPQEIPTAPTNLKLGAVTTITADLSWTDCSDNEEGFRIERSEDSGVNWTQHTATGAGIASVTVGNLLPNRSYQFQVRAYNAAGPSKPLGPLPVKTAPLLPVPPTSLRVEQETPTSVVLAWNDASDGEDGFLVERSDDACKNWSKVDTTPPNATSLLLAGLTPKTTYHARVSAYNRSGSSPTAGPIEFKTPQQIPGPPGGLTAGSLTATSVVLSWTKGTGTVDGYRVERSTSEGRTWTPDRATGAGVTTVTLSNLAAASAYRFRVRAFNSAGESLPSATVQVLTPESVPASPTALVYRELTPGSVVLAWNDASSNEVGFQVERSVDRGRNWVNDAVVPANCQSFAITNLAPQANYQFRVSAYNSAGASPPAGPLEFTTPARLPEAPSDLKPGKLTPTSVELIWNDNSDNEEGFRIERGDEGGRTWSTALQTPAKASSATLTGLIPDRGYQFRVRAFNSAGVSAAAGPVEVNTPQQPPAAPQNLQASGTTAVSVILGWTDCSDNEEGFRIERSDDGNKNWARCAVTGPNTQAAEVTGLASEKPYGFRVFAFNKAGESAAAGPITIQTLGTPPARPLALSASNVKATTVDLGWTDASSNEQAFVIEASQDLGRNWVEAGRTKTNLQQQTVTGLLPETRYQFRVSALNASGKSDPSNVVEVTTLGQAPLAPDNLTADPNGVTATSVELAWRDNSPNETEFEIFRAPAGGTAWQQVGKTSTNVARYTATGLTPATGYQFRVRAKNAWGFSPDTAAVVVTTRIARPNAPQNLTLQNVTARSLDLNWVDCSNDEDDFLIVCSINGGPFVALVAVPRDTKSYSVGNLQPLTKYCFRVQARNKGGESDFTPAACVQTKGVAPTAPSGFGVRSIEATAVTLEWKDNSDNETEFAVQGSTDGGLNYRPFAAFGANAQSGTVTGLKAGSRYLLRIQARNSWGESGFAGPVDFYTTFVIPDVPEQLTAVAVAKDQVDLSWTLADQVVDWFDVQYTIDGQEGWTVSQPSPAGTARRASVTGLKGDTRYKFRVRAVVNRAGASAWSNVASATTFVTVPVAPQELTVGTVTATTVDLSWRDMSENEAEFEVSRSTDGGLKFQRIGVSSANTPRFQVRDLKPLSDHHFQVRACNLAGCSNPTATVFARTKQAPPAAPTDLRVEKLQARQLTLVWNDCADEQGFEIERSLDGGSSFSPLSKVGVNILRETVTGLAPRTLYVFRVRAFNAGGVSDWAKPVSATTLDEIPAIPGKPVSVKTASRSIELEWADNSTNEIEFVLEMSSNLGQNWELKGQPAANTPRSLVTNLTPAKEYWFRVQARNAVGTSGYSEVLRETTRGEPPLAPGNLVAGKITQTSVDLVWKDNSSDEQFFDVEISRDRGQTWQLFKALAANCVALAVTGLDPGTEYWFQVRARNAAGSSSPAGPVQVITLGIPPDRPVLKLEGADSTSVGLSWTLPKGKVTEFALSSSLSGGLTWTVVARPKANETKASVANLTPDTEYSFQIEAYNGSVSSGASNPVTVRTKPLAPVAPSNLQLSDATATSLRLSWKDNSQNEAAFEIEMSDSDGANFVPFGVTEQNVVTFSAGSLAENRKYCFRVRARNSGGVSSWTDVVCGNTTAKSPAPPTDLRVVSATSNSAVVQWKAGPPPLDGFQIAWRPSGTTSWANQKKLAATVTFETLTGLTIDTTYDVQVSAFNAGVESQQNPQVSFVTLPAAPTGLVICNQTSNSLTLKWNDVSRTETEYRLQWSANEGRSWTLAEKLPPNSAARLVEGLVANTPYRFRLIATNGAGDSVPAEINGRTLQAVPGPPTNLKVVATTSSSVALVWTAAGSETGFELFRTENDQQMWQSLGQTLPTVTTYTDKGLKPLTKYWYRVLGFNAAGNSPPSEWVQALTSMTVPAVPSGVCVVNPKPTSLDVKWTDNSDNEDGFTVWVSADSVNYSRGSQVVAGVNCATLTGLTPETDYSVKVRAFNPAGETGDSNVAKGRTARRAPDQPGGLRVIDKSQTTLTLAWNAADTRATVLQIDISRNGGQDWQFCQRPGPDSTSTLVGDLSPNREYVFRIRAENEAGNSAWSAETRGCTLPPPPASPSGFAATKIGNIKLTLVWKNNATDASQNLIRMSTNQGLNFQDIALLAFANVQWTVTGLKPNTEYVFELFAVNGGLFSPAIPRVTVRTDNTPPTAPSNLLAFAAGPTSADLQWNPSSREEKYELQYSINDRPYENYDTDIPADTRSFRVTRLKSNTRYRFRIRAVNTVKASDWAVSGQVIPR
jgi:hypothetical protein